MRGQETAIGDFFADTMRAVAGADVALLNGGGIRGNRLYESGTKLTRKDIARELPFNNQLVTLELAGADLRAALENAVWMIGKDGYVALTRGKPLVSELEGPLLSNVVIGAIEKAGAIAPVVDGRIRVE